MHSRPFYALAFVGLLMISACDMPLLKGSDPDETAAPASLPPATVDAGAAPQTELKPSSEPFVWKAIEPSVVEEGPPVRINSSEGYAFALFSDTAVAPGDTGIATIEVNGPAERYLTAILQRHCDTANGSDATSENFLLAGGDETFIVRHTFETAYSCLRLTLRSQDLQPLEIIVNDVSLVIERSGEQ